MKQLIALYRRNADAVDRIHGTGAARIDAACTAASLIIVIGQLVALAIMIGD